MQPASSYCDVFENLFQSLSLSLFPRFNYRSTHYMSEHGFYDFLIWFDDRAGS